MCCLNEECFYGACMGVPVAGVAGWMRGALGWGPPIDAPPFELLTASWVHKMGRTQSGQGGPAAL